MLFSSHFSSLLILSGYWSLGICHLPLTGHSIPPNIIIVSSSNHNANNITNISSIIVSFQHALLKQLRKSTNLVTSARCWPSWYTEWSLVKFSFAPLFFRHLFTDNRYLTFLLHLSTGMIKWLQHVAFALKMAVILSVNEQRNKQGYSA